MYKNQLQELAQRSCFSLPSYTCIREGPDHAPRFKAVVSFNGEIFESPNYYSTLRQAEHAAAEVALHSLYCREPFRALVARIMDETSVCKNLLQEAAQRAGLSLPDYTTVRSGPGHMPVFKCIVEVAGMVFVGDPAKTKKQAEKNAAMAAWSALKLVNYQQRPPSLLLNGVEDSSLDPCMALAVIEDRAANSLPNNPYSSSTRTRSPFLSSLSSSGFDRALPAPTSNPPQQQQQRESSGSGRFYPPSFPNRFQTGSSSSVGSGSGAIAPASSHTRGLLNNPPKLPSVYSSKRYERDLAVAMAMAMEEHQKDEDEWLQRGAGGCGASSGGEIRVEREQSFHPSYVQKRYEHDLAVVMAMAMEEHQKDEEEREQQKQKQQVCLEEKREERERKSSSSLWPSRLQWWRGSSSSSSSSSLSPSMQRKPTEIRESRESVMAYRSTTNLAPPVRVRPMVAVCSAPPPRRHPEPHPPNPHRHFSQPQVIPRPGIDPNSNPEESTRELLNRLRL